MSSLYPALDSCDDLSLCLRYPIIYKVNIEQERFQDFLHFFVDEILCGSSFNKVDSALVNYITRVIEPTGWEAVWRATSESSGLSIECDFIVEVTDVSLTKLEADIILRSLIVPQASYIDIGVIQESMRKKHLLTVPLIELYPISERDTEEMYAKNAMAIEHIRFFYKHIARPWDSEEEDLYYTEKVVRPRLQLYFDIQQKILPEAMIKKIQSILKEGTSIMKELKSLYSNMGVSDSEAELQEDDVLNTLEFRKRLEELQRKMEILENPIIRTLIMKRYIPRKSPQKQSRPFGPITFIVAEHFTYEMVTHLNLSPDTNLHFDQSAEHAFKSCADGDTILIFPGQYRCDTLGWLDGPVIIKGIGKKDTIKLVATGNSDIFLNCDSQAVHLENITLISTPEVVSTIVIHHGNVYMKDCAIENDGAETGITLLGGSELVMDNCKMCGSKEDGIQLRSASSISLRSCRIFSCGRHAIQVDADEDLYDSELTTDLSLSNSHILDNQGHAIFVNSVRTHFSISEGKEEDILNSFRWLRYEIQNTTMDCNKLGNIGVSRAYKPIKSLIHLNKYSNPEPKIQSELECSILDDF